jgi:TolB-like protein/DNA-binding winged helix-turn-helix (wHTH) protein/Tfp pilus assembly protein PilF
MQNSSRQTPPVRFGAFELDLLAGGLRKDGAKVKLQDQPLQILAILLEHPGQLVTRDELRKRLWSGDTFVDFDHSLNKAVNKLRDALHDSAENPFFIETIPKRGYRFIAGVTVTEPAGSQSPPFVPSARRNRARVLATGVLLVLLVVGGLFIRRGSPLLTRAAPAPVHAVAVLPLKSVSGDSSQDYFADDMTGALTSDLSRIGSLTVISQTSAQRFRDTHAFPSQIARELNVDALVDGTVQKVGDRLRVTARILSGPEQQSRWSHTFERDAGDVLVLQAEVASSIAEQFKKELTPEEKSVFEHRPAIDPRAYDAYLKGDHYWAKFTEEDWKKAKQYFHEAIQIDPNYAAPYSALGGLLETEREWYGTGGDNLDDARKLTDSAIRLNPTNADAHITLGWILTHQWDLDAAEMEFRHAVALQPSHAYALLSLQHALVLRRRIQNPAPQLERVKALDPVSPQVLAFIGLTEYMLREYDRGLPFCREGVEIEPNFAFARYCQGKLLLAKKEPLAALAEFRIAREKGGNAIPYLSGLGQSLAAAGQRVAVTPILKQLEENPSSQKFYYLALVHCALRNKDQALTYLEQAYSAHSNDLIYLDSEPALDTLRTSPRFSALVHRLHLSSAPETSQPPSSKPVSIPALESYIQGHYHAEQAEGLLYRYGMQAAERKERDTAREFFQKAIQQDPTYAQAYVGLARTWTDRLISEDGPAKSEAFLRRAIQIEPELAEAHEALATLDVLRLWRWQEAEQEYRRAIELNPNSAEAHARYAEYLDCMKRFDEGMREFQRAQQLDPGHNFQPNPWLRRRQFQQAIEIDEGKVQRRELRFFSHQDLAFDYDAAGRHEEAAKEWEEMLRQLDYADLADAMRKGRKQSGFRGAYQTLVAALEAMDSHGDPVPAFFPAIFYAELRERERAFYWLERGYRERSQAYSALNVDPCWDPLRDDPRFKDLVRRVGLPQQ